MYDLNGMRIFANVVTAKGFTPAALNLKLSKSQVSKAIVRLEQSLGVRLLNRSTRRITLTEVGEAYYEHCERVLKEVANANAMISQLHQVPMGTLKLSTPVAFGTMHVAPALPDFLKQHPMLSVDMSITDRLVDLVAERYDVALRITGAPGPHLVAHRLAPIRYRICAAPEYLALHGTPRSIQDLAKHNCLSYTYLDQAGIWQLEGPDGEVSVPVSGNLRINDDEAMSQAVLGGLGLALLPTFIAGHALQSGKLQVVLPGVTASARYLYAVHLPDRHLPLKARRLIEFFAERFAGEPYWDSKPEIVKPPLWPRPEQKIRKSRPRVRAQQLKRT